MLSTTSSASVGQIDSVRFLSENGGWPEDGLLLSESILSASFSVLAASLVSLESVIALFPFVVAQASLAFAFAFRAHRGFGDACFALLCVPESFVRCCGRVKLWEGEELVLTMCRGPALGSEYTNGKLLDPSGALKSACCRGCQSKLEVCLFE